MTTELSTLNNLYIRAATSSNTRKAYQSDISHFVQWGGVLPTTSNIIIDYLQHYAATLNPRTLARRLTALSHWHSYQGFADPTTYPDVHKTLAGIHNIHGKPHNKAQAMTLEHLTLMCRHLQQSKGLKALRANAMLQIQFFGALRISDLLGMQLSWLSIQDAGIKLTIPRSKTDQTGQGQTIAIPRNHHAILCPVKALETWLDASCINHGHVFQAVSKTGVLSGKQLTAMTMQHLLTDLCAALELTVKYSSHSLRSGFATEASLRKASLPAIMRQGRWRNVATVLGYIEEGQRFDDNAANVMLHDLT